MKLKIEELDKLVYKIFTNYNLSEKHARICTDAIINAELVGAHSHGLSRLKMYCERINRKVINPKPKLKIKKLSQSISLIDADNSIGFVAADIGINQSIKNASKSGISLVAIKNSGHFGLSGYYLEKAAKKNLISLCFTNAPPAIAPFGSKTKLFGTNPIAFATPTNSKIPFIFDASMSKINRGKIRLAAKNNKKIEYGVALDKSGNVTTNAKKALKGVQLPIAEFKGSGLAWMVDILAGVFSGAAHAGKVKDPFDDFTGPQNVGHIFITFKSNLFTSNYKKRIEDNIRIVKKLPKAKNKKEIMYPGQNKNKRYLLNKKKNKIYFSNKINKDIKYLLRND